MAWSRHPWLRRRVPLILVLVVLFALARPAAVSLGGRAIAVAPNRGVSEAAVALPGELRVPVGPPRASLSLHTGGAVAAVARGTVFLLHGVRDRSSSLGAWADMLGDAGLRAVLVDSRGHGGSTGDWLTFGVVEARDLRMALDTLIAKGEVVPPFGAMGISYGAATAIQWAAIDPRVARVVAIASFASLRDVIPGYAPSWLPKGIVDDAITRAGELGGFDPDEASPVRAAALGTARLLLIHGARDTNIPPWHSERIAAAAGGRARRIVLPGETHFTIGADATGTIAREAPLFFLAP